jgi:hypothetical protein
VDVLTLLGEVMLSTPFRMIQNHPRDNERAGFNENAQAQFNASRDAKCTWLRPTHKNRLRINLLTKSMSIVAVDLKLSFFPFRFQMKAVQDAV